VSTRGFGADQPARIMVVSCPELRGAEQGRETARRHERVIAVVTGFCPNVEVVEPGMCAFGARGPARYFGGEAALAARLFAAVADLGIQVRIGVADGLFAALLAAGAAATAGGGDPVRVIPPGGTAGFLAAQPVSALADQDLAGLLKRLGLGTLGDFAALPSADVASRFGDAGERAHRLARGLDSRPLAARPPPGDLSVAQEFDPPEPRAEPVAFAVQRHHEWLSATHTRSATLRLNLQVGDVLVTVDLRDLDQVFDGLTQRPAFALEVQLS